MGGAPGSVSSVLLPPPAETRRDIQSLRPGAGSSPPQTPEGGRKKRRRGNVSLPVWMADL